MVRVAAGAAMAIILGSGLAHAHSDWAAPFMGGIMAGRVLSHIQEQKERQTQAMQEMARGGGYGGGFAGYGGGYGRPAYGAATAPAIRTSSAIRSTSGMPVSGGAKDDEVQIA